MKLFFRPFSWLILPLMAIALTMPYNNFGLAFSVNNMAINSIEKIVIRQAQAWENADSDAIIADFAEESVFIVADTIFRGKEAIKAAADDYFANFTDTEIEIKRIIVGNDKGAVEWNWQDRNRKTGERSYAEDAIIFELKNGKIVYWREYIEKKDPPNN